MLQQTRVGAVLERYTEFVGRFPDIASLAAARPHQVLAAWSGLGYYRRARALHQAARILMRDHAGRLPATSALLQTLPGIGRYTAAAIASIAFGEPCALVDGNVERVLRRFLGYRQEALPRIWSAAQELLSPRAPGNFNQALMELGATICLPAQPRCSACPVSRFCATQGPLERRAKPRRRRAEVSYGLALRGGRIYLVRRGARESLMPGMWELPRIQANGCPPDFSLRHSITITDYTVRVHRISGEAIHGGRWLTPAQAAALPLTGLARRVLQRACLI